MIRIFCLFLAVSLLTCCGKKNSKYRTLEAHDDFVKQYNKIVNDFKEKYKLNTKFDKKFKKLLKDQEINNVDNLYLFAVVMKMPDECALKSLKSGLEQIYLNNDKLLKEIIKKHPKILEEKCESSFKTNHFWNKKTQECKDLVIEEQYIKYKGEQYSIDVNGKIKHKKL